jgi:hypothetical protein
MQIRDLLQLQLPVGPGTQFARIQVSRPCNAAQRRILPKSRLARIRRLFRIDAAEKSDAGAIDNNVQ